jgi:hypothetical protein
MIVTLEQSADHRDKVEAVMIANMKSKDTKQSKIEIDKKVQHFIATNSKANQTVYAAGNKMKVSISHLLLAATPNSVC